MIGNQLGSFAAGEDIEELASDVFVALWQAGRTLQTEHLRGWLGRVARNQAISFLRKQRLQLVPDEDYLLVDERDAQKLLEAQERSDLLRNFEKLSEAVDLAYDLLAGRDDSASALAGEALSEVERAANYAGELAALPEAVKGAVFTLQDAAETLRDFRDGLDFSDEEFDRIESRLSLLRRLERKYNTDEAGLIDLLDSVRKRLDQIEYAGDRLQKLETLITKQAQQTLAAATELTHKRMEAAAALERLGIAPEARPETLTPEQFQQLAGIFGRSGC